MTDLVLDLDYNITKAEAQMRKLQRDYDTQKKKIENQKIKITASEENFDKVSAELEEARNNVKVAQNELKEYQAQLTEYESKGMYSAAEKTQRIISEKQRELENYKKVEQQKAAISTKEVQNLAEQELKLQQMESKLKNIGYQIVINNKKQNKFSEAFEKSSKSASYLGKRIKNLITSALFFSVITKAFTALRNEFGKLITESGTKTAALVSQLNVNLAVLGRTLYESTRPYIEWFLQKLVQITQILTVGIAKMLGKSVEEMQNLTKSTKKAGKEAKGAVAGFDEINTLTTSSSDSASSGMDFSSLNDPIGKEMALLTAIVSGAVLVLGVILAFTGVNIPLGIGLIAVGAVGLAASYAAGWDTLNDDIKSTLLAITAIISAYLLVLGVILAFTGANIPLGIGLIAVGAVGLVSAVTIDWQLLKTGLKKIFTDIWEWCKGWGSLILGIVLTFSGLYAPLGIALIAAGAKHLTTSQNPKWLFLLEKIKEVWSKIKDFWNKNIAKYFTAEWWGELGKKMINGLIKWVVNGLNKLIDKVNSFGSFIGLDKLGLAVPKLQIPQLATGAILPGGSPMLAWVNDQPKGQTYVEGSVDNIAAALEKVMTGKNYGDRNQTIVVPVYINDREIARATRSGNESLGNQTVFGGFANAY